MRKKKRATVRSLIIPDSFELRHSDFVISRQWLPSQNYKSPISEHDLMAVEATSGEASVSW
jgi:hypothetical protein